MGTLNVTPNRMFDTMPLHRQPDARKAYYTQYAAKRCSDMVHTVVLPLPLHLRAECTDIR